MIYFSLITLAIGIILSGFSIYEYRRNDEPSAYLLGIFAAMMYMVSGITFFYCA